MRRFKGHGVLLTAVVCVLAVVVGAGVWAVGTGLRWLGRLVDPLSLDATVREAIARLEASAGEFARSLQRAASGSHPTMTDLATAAAEWGFAVATVGTTPTGTQVWVVGVERNVPGEGTIDVWSCFAINIPVSSRVPVPSRAESRADVERIDCGETRAPESLAHAARWLDQRHAAAGLAAAAPSGRTAPSAGSVIDGLRIVTADDDGTTVRVDVVDEAGTVALGAPDSYLYGVRLVAGSTVAGDAAVTAVTIPVELDPAIRARAEADAVGLVESAWVSPDLGPRGEGVGMLDRSLGKLVSIVRYEASADGATVHLAVEVVAGGRYTDNPAPSPIIVCVEVATEGQGDPGSTPAITVEPCRYPLVAPNDSPDDALTNVRSRDATRSEGWGQRCPSRASGRGRSASVFDVASVAETPEAPTTTFCSS